jgi:RNA polymerase sigma factor (sigma-70 family)
MQTNRHEPASPRSGVFNTTQWSVVLAAGETTSPASQAALAELCQAYWLPLYAYARRKGHSQHDAEDLAQSFFARLIERRSLSTVDQQGGRFRSYLLTSFQRFIIDEWRKNAAAKRGDAPVLSLDAAAAENWFATESERPPDELFIKGWALSVLDRALEALRADWIANDKGAAFDRLQIFLTDAPEDGAYDELARALDMDSGAIAVTVHRLRQQYRKFVRAQIAQTVDHPREIESELRELMAVLRKSR